MPEELRQAGFVALWHPGLMAVVLLLAAAYLLAVGSWRHRFPGSRPATGRQKTAFLLGLLTLYLAVGSPLDFVSDNLLMSAHMAEHMLLTFVLPPLLLLGTPDWLLRPVVVGNPVVHRVFSRLTRPLTALVLFNLVFSLVHIPAIYDATLRNDPLHFTEHAVLVITGIFLWWPVLSPLPEMPRLSDMLQLGYLFINEIFQTIAFALITFANHPLYSVYDNAPLLWGISRMEDQQLGGVLMKMGAMASIIPAMWDAFFRWARREGANRTDFLTAAVPPRSPGAAGIAHPAITAAGGAGIETAALRIDTADVAGAIGSGLPDPVRS